MGLLETLIEDNKNMERRQQKTDAALSQYGLSNLQGKDREIAVKIMDQLDFKMGMNEVGYLKAIMQQNWIIIRQLDEISKKLGK